MTVHGMHREASIEIQASPEAVYDLVSDLPRMGEWSPENIGGEWQGGGSGKVGDRFTGHNRAGERTWSAPVMVTAAERGRCFAFVIGPDAEPVCALDLPPGAQRGRHARDGSVGCGTTPADAAELDPGTTGRAGAPHRRHADQDPCRPQKDGRGLSVRAHARRLPSAHKARKALTPSAPVLWPGGLGVPRPTRGPSRSVTCSASTHNVSDAPEKPALVSLPGEARPVFLHPPGETKAVRHPPGADTFH